MSTSLAFAQDLKLEDYFQLGYDPVTFDKTEIHGSEVFYANITGRATCIKDLPLSPSEASITSQVVAVHTASGTRVTLNSSYTVNIKPFPSEKGETVEINRAVPLQFPVQAEAGDYNIIGKVAEAKVKVSFLPTIPVTDFLPQEQPMGSVKYIAPESTAAPVPTPSEPPPSTSTPPPPISTPASTPTPAPAPSEPIMPWWGELLVLIAVATTIFNIIWFLRHRRR
jgi:hypothetical protein